MPDSLNDHTVNKLTDAVLGLTHELCAVRGSAAAGMVSRTDLAEAEARITKAIGDVWGVEDQKILDGLLDFARRKTLQLEALDRKYNNQP